MIEALKQKLGEEVEKLQYELNVTLPGEIRRAVEHGDLRENSEYKAALERQQFVQARLGQLRQRLSKLSQIDVSQIPSDKVGLGSQVVVQDEKTGERESYSLVFGDSVEFEEGHVSMSSPFGKTLVGRSVGETVVLKLPAMTRRLLATRRHQPVVFRSVITITVQRPRQSRSVPTSSGRGIHAPVIRTPDRPVRHTASPSTTGRPHRRRIRGRSPGLLPWQALTT